MPMNKLEAKTRLPTAFLQSQRVVLGPFNVGGSNLYFGDDGTANWFAVTSEPNYPLNAEDKFSLRVLRQKAIEAKQFGTLVSFGPGDGSHDNALLTAMQPQSNTVATTESMLRYIPIDVSNAMLKHAIKSIDSGVEMPPVQIPIAVQCDFEYDGEFLSQIIDDNCIRPALYSMLGGTFANLVFGEAVFLQWLRGLLQSKDAFLVDLPTAGPEWTVDYEPRMRADSYSPAFRRFLAFGMVQSENVPDWSREEQANRILADFENRVGYFHNTDANTGAEQITVLDKVNDRVILRFRRYRFAPLISWLKLQGFNVVYSALSDHCPNNRFGMGVILIEHD